MFIHQQHYFTFHIKSKPLLIGTLYCLDMVKHLVSIDINVITPNKEEWATVLEAIADTIRNSGNKKVSIQLEVDFK